jgi:hypothetical protein
MKDLAVSLEFGADQQDVTVGFGSKTGGEGRHEGQ